MLPPLLPSTGWARRARRSEWPRPGTPAATIVLKKSSMADSAPPWRSGDSASFSTSGSTDLWIIGMAWSDKR